MAKKKNQPDFIEDHYEYVNHMYNPGYWVNKVTSFHINSWRWTRKYNRLNGFLGLLFSGFSPLVSFTKQNKSQDLRK